MNESEFDNSQENWTMKAKYFLTIGVLLTMGLVLCATSGCKKKEAVNDVPSAKGATDDAPSTTVDTPGPTAPPAQVDQTPQAQVTVKPALDENTISEGRAFPRLEFTSLSGDQVSLDGLKGKAVLVDFWASWCGPCLRAMPDLIETYKQYHDQGFEIIGISLDKDKARLQQYIQEQGITWKQYYDGLGWDNEIAKRFGVRGIPHIVLVDKNGAVHFNTDYDNNKYPLAGVALRNVVAELCNAPAN